MDSLVLTDDIYSPDLVGTVIMNLNTYQGELRDYTARERTKSKAKRAVPEPDALLSDLLQTNSLTNPTADSLDAFRASLEQLLEKAPVAHLTLAGLPNSIVKKKITAWFRTQVSPHMLLTFAVRHDIGGGAVVQTGSKVYDFSFKNLLIANKQKLAEIASRV